MKCECWYIGQTKKEGVSMKKIISAVVVSAMLLTVSGVSANDSAPTMLYNNRELKSETYVPFISDGRTMLPFRYFLDEIGATVDYDDASRTVKAEKDGIAIAFSLDDTYIDITKDGNTERINQDVKNEIKDDRVYVPIRFMSEAFGLNVGWDSEEKVAIIVDIPQYVKVLEEKAPDFKRYMEITSKLPESYTQEAALNLSVDYAGEESGSIAIGMNYDMSLNGGAVAADVRTDLKLDIPSLFEMAQAVDMKDITFLLRYNDGQFYMQTNIIDKLKELYPDNEDIKNASLLMNSSTWFKADIKELFETIGLPVEIIDAVKKGLSGNINDEDFAEIITATYSQDGIITSVGSAQMIDTMFETYAHIFKDSFKITENGSGSYDVEMKIDKDFIVDSILTAAGFDEEIKNSPEYAEMAEEIRNAIAFDCTANVKIRNNIAEESNMNINFGMNFEGMEFNIKVGADAKLTPDTKKEITMPESAINLIDLIKLFK